jgi:hypothetical protein
LQLTPYFKAFLLRQLLQLTLLLLAVEAAVNITAVVAGREGY